MFTFEMLIKSHYTVHLSNCQGQSFRQDFQRDADNCEFKKLKIFCNLHSHLQKEKWAGKYNRWRYIYPSGKGYTSKNKIAKRLILDIASRVFQQKPNSGLHYHISRFICFNRHYPLCAQVLEICSYHYLLSKWSTFVRFDSLILLNC